ncbi:polyphosphate kinase 2 family protein [Akkermansiaceae bacterium]|nr:polyphosphate kinase 2 family protein [Akkermansiaceae bacterium]MDA7888843.1 polyphosphate kinase 2 family protein [Akkermansiaceae bacterium]
MTEMLGWNSFRYDGGRTFKIGNVPTSTAAPYRKKSDYKEQLAEGCAELDELQQMMSAQARHGVLVIFQAMDAAGKDGTIRRVFSGVNPQGVSVHSFKRPSEEELHHDFLWRSMDHLPARGAISIFNRSYYEEVLVARVHPEIVKNYQRLPEECLENFDTIWEQRWTSMREHEAHLVRNGIRVLKFFLNVSKEEQKQRFIDRIDEEEKNWKFNEGDLKERALWDDYQQAFEETINATGTKEAPWYVIPADDKKTARLLVSQIIRKELRGLGLSFPKVSPERREELQEYRAQLLSE